VFSNLPILHNSETLYSWFAHVHALNGGANATRSSQALLGEPHAALVHDFPSRLNRLHQVTGGCLVSPRELALNHTLLGYFLATVCRQEAETLIVKAAESASPHLKMQLGITASRVGGLHPLRGCFECISEEEERHGWAFWHTEHQFPSTFVCAKHHRLLATVHDAVSPVHRRAWLMPSTVSASQWQSFDLGRKSIASLVLLARNSEGWSRLPPGSLNQGVLSATYREAMFNFGIVTKKGNIRLELVPGLLRERFHAAIDAHWLSEIARGSMGWTGVVAAISRRVSRPAHPLKHLVLITTLFDSWAKFKTAYDLQEIGQSPHDVDVAALPIANRRREEFQRLVRSEGLSITAASRSVGISTTSGTQWAKKMEIAFTSRAKSFTQTQTRLATRLLGSGTAVAKVADRVGVSVTTVNRLIGSSASLQKRRTASLAQIRRTTARVTFARACGSHKKLPLAKIRALPNNSYMWLYRHDRDWLSRTLAYLGRAPHRPARERQR
jgi:transposase